MSPGYQRDTRRKVFISCSHSDRYYRYRFEDLFGHLFIIKPVKLGDISTDVSTEYIECLIQENYISVASVLVVLVGRNTRDRKHVDWEISAALKKKVDGYSGLLGLCLPTHPAYREDKNKTDFVPYRLADNLKAGYAKFYDWTESESSIKSWVEDTFQARISRADKIDNSRPLDDSNKCPKCGRPTVLTEKWSCQWCGHLLLSEYHIRVLKALMLRLDEKVVERTEA